MANYNNLLFTIKGIVKETMQAAKLSTVLFGVVTNAAPLSIQIDQKLIVSGDNLILPQYLTNYTVPVVIDGTNKSLTVNNALSVNDKVILIRQDGGQKFLIIDKVV